jgi:hypothetical protein
MRVRELRVSGFKSIPFCAEVRPIPGRGKREVMEITWSSDAFGVMLPVTARPERPMLAAVMGANSAGKSNILRALDCFFSPAVKLDPSLFNGLRTDAPLVVEVTLEGEAPHPGAWHALNCVRHGNQSRLTVASVWTGETRTRYIRRGDGRYYRQSQQDRGQCDRLLPEFRMIWADRLPGDEANLERRSLLSDVLDGLLAQRTPDSVLTRAAELLGELETLLGSRDDASGWQPVEDLEASLASGLAAITPQSKAVRLHLERKLPSLRGLFAQGVMSLEDGVDLDFAQHGLGIQRSLAIAALNTWCEYIRDADRHYLFAVEEPEIYLHPHATRVTLNLLEKVARHDQVIFTTHASEFVNRVPLDQIITVQRRDTGTEVSSAAVHPNLRGLARDEVTKVQRYLREDRSDMLFARAVLLVEGQAELFALPGFAHTLDLDLDAGGVSVVFVNGIGNFDAYHRILAAFQIPHAVLMDGDGEARARRTRYAHLGDALFVLDRDFETLLAEALTPSRLVALMNACLAYKGRPPEARLGEPRRRAKDLAALGKPLVGRVAAEMLTRDEIQRMPILVEALTGVLRLGAIPHAGRAARP